jgi:hypothetical protein
LVPVLQHRLLSFKGLGQRLQLLGELLDAPDEKPLLVDLLLEVRKEVRAGVCEHDWYYIIKFMRKEDEFAGEAGGESVQVALRVRPLNPTESMRGDSVCVEVVGPNTI